MTTYIVTSKSTGAELYRYSADAPAQADLDNPAISVAEEIVFVPPPDEPPVVYINPVRRLTKLQFVAQIGEDAFKEVLKAAKVSVDLEAFVKLIDWATPDADGTSIDKDDPRTAAGLYALEDAGFIAPGRAAEILNG